MRKRQNPNGSFPGQVHNAVREALHRDLANGKSCGSRLVQPLVGWGKPIYVDRDADEAALETSRATLDATLLGLEMRALAMLQA